MVYSSRFDIHCFEHQFPSFPIVQSQSSASWVISYEELMIRLNNSGRKSITNPSQTDSDPDYSVFTAGHAFVVWPIRAHDLCTKDLDVKMAIPMETIHGAQQRHSASRYTNQMVSEPHWTFRIL